MAFMYYEGTKDFLAATPALIVTFRASGSISAGRGVCFETNDNSTDVYQPGASTESGSLAVAGVALKTVSDNDEIPVLIWGYAKALPKHANDATAMNPGTCLVITGAGYWCASGSDFGVAEVAGKVVSGSTTHIVAFINCIK